MSKKAPKTKYQLVLIRQDRVLVNLSSVLASFQVILDFFQFLFQKDGSVGRWETKHEIGMALSLL